LRKPIVKADNLRAHGLSAPRGVLIVLSISYGEVSTVEVDAWSCSAGVAAGACVKLYRVVWSRERTRDKDVRSESLEFV
jgi:hypothetical protein